MMKDKLIKVDKHGTWFYLTIQDQGGKYIVHTQSNEKIRNIEKCLNMSKYAVYFNGKFAWYASR